MNLLDLIIVGTMVFLIVRGLLRGFIKELGSIAGVILGIWAASVYQGQATDYLRLYLPTVEFFILQLISFALVFAIVLILCNIAGLCLHVLLKKAVLGWTDRVLGGGLAILKGIIITYLMIVLLTFFVPSKAPLIAKSRLAPLTISSYQSLVSIFSPDFYRKWKGKFFGNKAGTEDAGSKKPKNLPGKDGSR
jgi:membrane protein required for colicin V production